METEKGLKMVNETEYVFSWNGKRHNILKRKNTGSKKVLAAFFPLGATGDKRSVSSCRKESIVAAKFNVGESGQSNVRHYEDNEKQKIILECKKATIKKRKGSSPGENYDQFFKYFNYLNTRGSRHIQRSDFLLHSLYYAKWGPLSELPSL